MKLYMAQDLKTNIITDSIYSEESCDYDFNNYLIDEMYKVIKDGLDVTGTIKSDTLGELKYTVTYNECLNDDYAFVIRVDIDDGKEDSNDRAQIDAYYDALYDLLYKNSAIMDQIHASILEYISAVNAAIKNIKVPKNENFMFKNDSFYIEYYTGSKYAHAVEWVSLAVDNTVDLTELLENLG